jgi:hypothetical protein
VLCDDDSVEVPLVASLPTPKLVFNPLLSFGKVVVENTSTQTIELRNVGHREAVWSLEWEDDSPVRVTPSSGRLAPRGKFVDADADGRMEEEEFVEGGAGAWTQALRVDFTADEVGEFRTLIKVKVAGQPTAVLDVSATVVDQKLELVLPGTAGMLTNLPLGVQYFGERREVKAVLVNNGPARCSFSATIADRFEVSEGSESVTVTAHTSTGETFIAGSGKGPAEDFVRAALARVSVALHVCARGMKRVVGTPGLLGVCHRGVWCSGP